MARQGEVSYRVKRAIAFHERFTIAQIADSTRLTYEQVEQVVHRLTKRGDVRRLLPEESIEAERRIEKRVGRPRARYVLSDDPVRRAEFLAGLESIAAAARLEFVSARRPDTPYYVAALKIIEAIEIGNEKVRLSRLKEADELLIYGREYEAIIPEGLEVAQAYYDLALARLKSLGKDFPTAERLLEQAETILTQAGLKEEARRATERRLAVRVTQALSEVSNALHSWGDPILPLQRLREVLLQVPNSPMHSALCRAIELLTEVLRLGPPVQQAHIWALRQNTEAVHRLARAFEPRFGIETVSSTMEQLSRSGEQDQITLLDLSEGIPSSAETRKVRTRLSQDRSTRSRRTGYPTIN